MNRLDGGANLDFLIHEVSVRLVGARGKRRLTVPEYPLRKGSGIG